MVFVPLLEFDVDPHPLRFAGNGVERVGNDLGIAIPLRFGVVPHLFQILFEIFFVEFGAAEDVDTHLVCLLHRAGQLFGREVVVSGELNLADPHLVTAVDVEVDDHRRLDQRIRRYRVVDFGVPEGLFVVVFPDEVHAGGQQVVRQFGILPQPELLFEVFPFAPLDADEVPAAHLQLFTHVEVEIDRIPVANRSSDFHIGEEPPVEQSPRGDRNGLSRNRDGVADRNPEVVDDHLGIDRQSPVHADFTDDIRFRLGFEIDPRQGVELPVDRLAEQGVVDRHHGTHDPEYGVGSGDLLPVGNRYGSRCHDQYRCENQSSYHPHASQCSVLSLLTWYIYSGRSVAVGFRAVRIVVLVAGTPPKPG